MQELLLLAAKALETEYLPILGALFLAALYFAKNKKTLLVAMAFAVLLVIGVKELYMDARPCVAGSIVGCEGYGFPSAHAASSIVLAAGTIGTPAFFLFLPLAFFISWTRLFLGLHSVNQVVGGIALGLAAYFIVRAVSKALQGMKAEKRKAESEKEERRQWAHLAFGVLFIILVLFAGIKGTEIVLLASLLVGGMLLNFKLMGYRVPVIEEALKIFEREKSEFPAKGALLYVVGSLLLLSFTRSPAMALAGISLLAFGDGFSTLVGTKWGKHKLFWNKGKSFEGLAAFVAFGFASAYVFIGMQALVYALVLAFVESLDIHLDDNLSVPIAFIALSFLV